MRAKEAPCLPGVFSEPTVGFAMPGDGPHHDGVTYEPPKDHQRLNAQTLRVFQAMRRGGWWTLRQLSDETGAPEASVSARMRDLRKPQFGGHFIVRARVGDSGLFKYQLTPNPFSADLDAQECGA